MEVSARLATRDDLTRITELAGSAREEGAGQRGGALWALLDVRPDPVVGPLAQMIDAVDALAIVGCIDAVVVGYAVVTTRTLRDGSVLATLTDLYVYPGAREVGVGESMMDRVLSWCEARGCRGVDAVALPGNRALKNFFERYGLVARAIVVHKPLGAPTHR
jgi:ribosomal protein S18 acetylase RimI-like enzyme